MIAGVRYRLPSEPPVMIEKNLFALGSTIYFIATGYDLHHELADENEVEKLYEKGISLELGAMPFVDAISLCWKQEVKSA